MVDNLRCHLSTNDRSIGGREEKGEKIEGERGKKREREGEGEGGRLAGRGSFPAGDWGGGKRK